MNVTAPTLSIGDLASRSGVGISAIRAWERRYGRPSPVRLASGHRRYATRDVRWLLRVCEALRRGLRPAAVVPASDAALARMLAATEPRTKAGPRDLDAALACIRRFDRPGLTAMLAKWRGKLPASRAVLERIAPLIERIGDAWAEGRLSVRHEHFATEVIEAFLNDLGSAPSGRRRGPRVLLATLSGERHALGLAMAAAFVRLAGADSVVLGADVPNREIVDAAADAGLAVVAVSVSAATGGPVTHAILADLRRRLPAGTALVVGGAGARGRRRGIAGVTYMASLDAFAGWLRENVRAGRGDDV